MAPHSSTLAWKMPWTEEPGRLQSMRSLRVGHDWVTSLSLFTFLHWSRLPCPPSGDLPNPGTKPRSLTLQAYSLPYESPESESEVAQSCLTLCDPMDCNLPGSSIHGIFQARVLEWGAIAFSFRNPKQIKMILGINVASLSEFPSFN